MNRAPLRTKLTCLKVILIFSFLGTAGFAQGQQTLEQFLSQVNSQNQQAQALKSKSENAPLAARQADLLYSPQLSIDANIMQDKKPSQTPGLSYDRIDASKTAFGIAQQFEFGLQAKIKYEVQSQNLKALSVSGQAVGDRKEVTATPTAELSLPLWQNSGGKQTAENAKLIRTQAKVEDLAAKAMLDGIVLDAEMRYWNLSIKQAVTRIQQKYFDKTSALVDYVRKRVSSDLGDESELFQVTAAYEAGQLELESARQDELIAWQDYNAARETNANENGPIALESIPLEKLVPPAQKPGSKSSTVVLAATTELAQSGNAISADKLRPTLDAFASFALNNPESEVGDALSSSFETDRPTSVVGLRFSMPLGMSAASDARRSALESAKISQLDYAAKVAQEDREFAQLAQKLTAAQRKHKLSLAIEAAQKRKLDNESKRLKVGRTILFNVLQFEQDLLRSQLGTLRAAAEIVTTHAQLKLFSRSEP